MNEGRLCDLALMRIERDDKAKAYLDEFINGFTSMKAQKCCFN